jgi:hydroxypyruvate reductase
MAKSAAELRADAERIWRAGVAGVMPDLLVREHVQIEENWLVVGDEAIDLNQIERIAIVGGGKAAGAMAASLESVLGQKRLQEKDVVGWVNVPADCIVPTSRVQLHAARPAGVNEPRAEGVEGTQRILEIVASLGPADLCFCVLTGGGSALLPAPVAGVSLDDKIRVTQLLSAAGANIEQLNTVRRILSRVKGGGLARACRAGRLVSLIISDVLGDPLEAIASGPTVISKRTRPADALAVLDELELSDEPDINRVVHYLREQSREELRQPAATTNVTDLILGNNATAVDAAGVVAERLGYSHAMISATRSEGAAEGVGRHLAEMAVRMRREPGPDCLISGGEPTVELANENVRGKGGRNQQLALAALKTLDDWEGVVLLSGGTDGEDGPTDAAGAFVTADIVREARRQGLDPRDFLARNDAYHFFERTGGLFVTGPTQTNVCDLRVIVVDRA